MERMTQKEHLFRIIKTEGRCFDAAGLAFFESTQLLSCSLCLMYQYCKVHRFSCTTDIHNEAIKRFIEKYGKEELVEMLI